MIETPTVTAFTLDGPESAESDTPLLSDQKESKSTSAIQPELLIVKTKPITAKIRTTMKHLRAQAGPWSRFRGLHVFIMYHFMYTLMFSLLSSFFGSNTVVARLLAAVVTSLALCRWGIMWTHLVISAPSTKPWYYRVPDLSNVKNVVIPTIVYVVAEQATISVPVELFSIFGLSTYISNPERLTQASPQVQKQVLVQVFIIMMTSLIISFLVLLPSVVSLTRVQASMLPEEDESIVPFDRTFGGKVVPKLVGGSGAVSMLDAWKSFDMSARFRLVKLFAKVCAIELVTTLFFAMIGAFELHLILAKSKAKGSN